MTDDERRNLAVITEVCDAYNRHDVEGIVRHFAEGSSWLLSRGVPPEGGRAKGLDEIRAMAHRRFRTIPDMYWHIRSHWVSGNRGLLGVDRHRHREQRQRDQLARLRHLGAERRGPGRHQGHLLENLRARRRRNKLRAPAVDSARACSQE